MGVRGAALASLGRECQDALETAAGSLVGDGADRGVVPPIDSSCPHSIVNFLYRGNYWTLGHF